MRDPRLAEIEFLAAVERQPLLYVPAQEPWKRLGLSKTAMEQMLFEMLAEQFLNGPALALAGGTSDPKFAVANLVNNDLASLCRGGSLHLQITHRGRVHLFRRRDELRADRGRDQFGILFDRRAWDRELAVQLIFATDSEPLALLFLDLDHFKDVNDGMGHAEGDRVLKRYMEIARDVVADRGDAYRVGGDELTVCLPKTSLQDATAIAERIRTVVEAEFRSDKVPVTASIGVAAFRSRVEPTAAVKLADEAMYTAKAEGKNRVRVART
jgi:diguanylate cyclase (GGDEF)-like protein